MFAYSTGHYVSPPDDQYLKFKNRCSLMPIFSIRLSKSKGSKISHMGTFKMVSKLIPIKSVSLLKLMLEDGGS